MTKYINDLVTHLEDALNQQDDDSDDETDVLSKIALIRKRNQASRVFEIDLPLELNTQDIRQCAMHLDDFVWFFKVRTDQVKTIIQKLKCSMLRIFEQPIEEKRAVKQYGRGTLDLRKHQQQFQTVHLNPFFNQTSLQLDLQDMSTLINYEPKIDANMSLIIDPDQIEEVKDDKAIILTGFIKIEIEIAPIDYSQYMLAPQNISFKQILDFKQRYQYLISNKEGKQTDSKHQSLLQQFVQNHYKQEVDQQNNHQLQSQISIDIEQTKGQDMNIELQNQPTQCEIPSLVGLKKEDNNHQNQQTDESNELFKINNLGIKKDEQDNMPQIQIDQDDQIFPDYHLDIDDEQYLLNNEQFEEHDQGLKADEKQQKKSSKNNFHFSVNEKPHSRDSLQSGRAEPYSVQRELAIKHIEEVSKPIGINRYFEFFMVKVNIIDDDTQESIASAKDVEFQQEEFKYLNEEVPLTESNYAIPFQIQKTTNTPTTIKQLSDIIAMILDSIKMKKVQFQKIYQTFEYVLKGESISRAKFFASLLFVAKSKGIVIESQNKSDFEFYF